MAFVSDVQNGEKNILVEMGPGPMWLPDYIRAVAGIPAISHRGSDMDRLTNENLAGLALVYGIRSDFSGTSGWLITPFGGQSGTSGINNAIENVTKDGDRVVLYANGAFGNKLGDGLKNKGLEVIVITEQPGSDLNPSRLRETLEGLRQEGKNVKLVAVVDNNTCMGQVNPTQNLAEVVSAFRGTGQYPLLLADYVSSRFGTFHQGVNIGITTLQKDANGYTNAVIIADPLATSVALEIGRGGTDANFKELFKAVDKIKGKAQSPNTPQLVSQYALNRILEKILGEDFPDVLSENPGVRETALQYAKTNLQRWSQAKDRFVADVHELVETYLTPLGYTSVLHPDGTASSTVITLKGPKGLVVNGTIEAHGLKQLMAKMQPTEVPSGYQYPGWNLGTGYRGMPGDVRLILLGFKTPGMFRQYVEHIAQCTPDAVKN